MFGFFGKKRKGPYASVLTLPPKEFIYVVTDMVSKSDLASRAMMLVALANLDVYLSVLFKVGKENPRERLPTNLDDAIEFFEKNNEQSKNELSQRRMQWFLLASLVKRATVIAIENKINYNVEDIWISLAEAGAHINHHIENNLLWEENEKICFSSVREEKSGKSYVLWHMMPKELRSGVRIKKYCNENDIFLLGW